MGSGNVPLLAFNRGTVSRYALAHVDMEVMRLAAETQTNWMPTTLGPMMLRPGFGTVSQTKDDNTTKLVPFVFSTTDRAMLEFTNNVMRVFNISSTDTETLLTRASVTTAVTNGDFAGSAGWTLTTTGSGAVATISGGLLTLASPAFGGIASAENAITISGGDQGTEHALRIVVDTGPVTFRIGTTSGDDDVLTATTLLEGTHSLAFTPSVGTVYAKLETTSAQSKIVSNMTVEASGTLELPTTWVEADLSTLRWDQSADVLFVACAGQIQRRIERRSSSSWSFVKYQSDNGPFDAVNLSDTTLTPTALTGNTTVTASRAAFKSTEVGRLLRLFSAGQTETASLTAENTFTTAIRVTGVDNARRFNITRAGTWNGTLTLQRSFTSATTGFSDTGTAYTTNGTQTNFDDGLDNQIVWYRLGFKTGDFTSGTAALTLEYSGGGDAGIGRITGYTSATVVSVEVLTPFSSLDATTVWNKGSWSDLTGYPTAVTFFDGRLWWAAKDTIYGSVSDDFDNFDFDAIGDSAPIIRSVGFGPVDTINWLMPLNRLVVGRQGAETSIRSGSFDEPLTPTNFTLKDATTQGSAPVAAIKIDTRGIFIQRSQRRVYQLSFKVEDQDYIVSDLTRLNTEIGGDGLTALALRRQPDTELYFVRADGKMPVLLHDRDDEVSAWWLIEMDGTIEDVISMPGQVDDLIYVVVNRTVNGGTVRTIEKMARREQSRGQPECRCLDGHVVYDGVSTTTITGLDHLEGETDLYAWTWDDADSWGQQQGPFTVASGSVTLTTAAENAVVGKRYTATFKSAKLAYAAERGTALTQKKKVSNLGLILADVHQEGLQAGRSATDLDNLRGHKDGKTVTAGTVHSEYDNVMTHIPGEWNTDSRLWLVGTAPKPVTVMAAVVDVQTNG